MGRRVRRGVSGYLEVFLLAAVAIGGSGLVLGAATSYVGTMSGPSASLASASIREGSLYAVESVALSNVGTVPLGGIVLATSQAPSAAHYCYYLQDPRSGTTISSTCPGGSVGPALVSVAASVQPGTTLVIVLLVDGGGFALGSTHEVSVTCSSGAQASVAVRVDPA